MHKKQAGRKRITARIIGSGLIVAGVLALLVGHGVLAHRRHARRHSKSSPAIVQSSTSDVLAGQWNYLPGATREATGLRIHDDDFVIVEQDGSGGQPNPPVNLFGTHLNVSGDFSVEAGMSDIKGQSSLQLYGQVPIIQDEFRVERPSVRLTISGNQLQVGLWDGFIKSNLTNQAAVVNSSFGFEPKAQNDVLITRSGGQLSFSVNGQAVGSVKEKDIFNAGQVWFGADSKNGSWLLTKLKALPLNGGVVQIADASASVITNQGPDALQTLAGQKRPGFLVGAAMALAPTVSDPAYADIAYGGNFGSLTTENALKWQFIEPRDGVYDFHEADALVALATKQNMVVHGHTLVFSEANPQWVRALPTATAADKAAVKQKMVDHINTTVGHFKGKIATWDVVNEPMADYETFGDGNAQFRSNKWFSAMGKDYIATAFNAAHQADPVAKLFINDYGLEANDERWDAFVTLVSQLKAQGVPIDGVGFESHIYEAGDVINIGVLRQHIQQLAKLGLVVRISEMDVYNDDGQAVQTQQYSNVFAACIAEPNCISWTTWGVSDRYDMWQDDNKQLEYGEDFLWDNHMQPTPAVAAIQKILKN